jgi:hypothetical protein
MAVKGENPGARQWHQPLVRHFEEAQQRKREWINFAEIAKWRSELDGSAEPNEIARESAYKMLESDLLEGVFEERGRSQVLFLCSGVSWTHRKMTRQWLQDAINHNLDGDHGRFYLQHCWLPRELFKRWCARHHLPISPPRFEPRENIVKAEHLARSNTGGRPPKVDWDALKDPLREEIKKFGYPDRQNPPGWQRTSDVVEWAFEQLGRTENEVSARTVADHIRGMLRELRTS